MSQCGKQDYLTKVTYQFKYKKFFFYPVSYISYGNDNDDEINADKLKSEIDFEFQNRPYRFIDLESNLELKLHPNEVKKLYVKAMKEYYEELKIKCGQFQIDYVEADINKGFHQILMPYFIKRKKMH